jgi:hypothetical protein
MKVQPCQTCGAALTPEARECTYCGTANPLFEELQRKEARADELAERRRRQRRLALGLGALALLAILVVSALVGQSQLKGELAEVERSHAQVKNVIERQAVVEARFRDAPAGPDRDAELIGAENRVRIERGRYDKAASQYNAHAGEVFGGLWARLFGMPARVPLSNEVTSW